jgi:hypothetical protein
MLIMLCALEKGVSLQSLDSPLRVRTKTYAYYSLKLQHLACIASKQAAAPDPYSVSTCNKAAGDIRRPYARILAAVEEHLQAAQQHILEHIRLPSLAVCPHLL